VIAKCGHYFCESCALNQYRINPGCAVCHTSTGGSFKPAKEIVAKLKQQNQLKEQLSKPSTTNDQSNSEEEEEAEENNP
jgi:RING finger protein 113A